MGRRARKPKVEKPEVVEGAPKRPSMRAATVTPEDPAFAGTLNIWAILAADADDLAAEVEKGEHDRILDYMRHCEMSRERRQRRAVLEAIDARRALREG